MVIEFILCTLKDLSIELGSQISLFVVVNIIIIIFLGGAYVTNKEICLVRIVSYLCKVLCHLFARLLIEKIRPFFLAIGFCFKYAFITSQSLLRHNMIPD